MNQRKEPLTQMSVDKYKDMKVLNSESAPYHYDPQR